MIYCYNTREHRFWSLSKLCELSARASASMASGDKQAGLFYSEGPRVTSTELAQWLHLKQVGKSGQRIWEK